jgi:signal transduction histidine kinase
MIPFARWRRAIQAAFRRWVRAQDEGEVLTASTLEGWLSLGVLVVASLCAAHYAPGAKLYFDLPLDESLPYFLPCFLLGLAFALLHRRRQRIAWWGWLLILLGTASLHFFMANLMALSKPPGATIFAALLLFTTAVHGRLHRVTLQTPFLALGTVLALALAALLHRPVNNLALFALVGPTAVMAELYLGIFAVKHDKARREAEQLRAAVQAQLMDQQERDVGQLSQALAQILGYNHDINTALINARSAADVLSTVGKQRTPLPRPELEGLTRELKESLARIDQMVLEIRQKGQRLVIRPPEDVDVPPVLEAVRDSLGLRFPDVHIQVKVEAGEPLRASLRGGLTTLRRVVENLVLNACEGDGTRGATQVDIRARLEPHTARLELVIADDGPGFPAERLTAPIEGLSSTKPHGTGLGLYTAECLIRASGGTLERSNRPTGGAQLRILLPPQELR